MSRIADKVTDTRQRNKLKKRLKAIDGFIEDYRNIPLHGLEGRILTIEDVKMKTETALDTLRRLVEHLASELLLKYPTYPPIGVISWDEPTSGDTDEPRSGGDTVFGGLHNMRF